MGPGVEAGSWIMSPKIYFLYSRLMSRANRDRGTEEVLREASREWQLALEYIEVPEALCAAFWALHPAAFFSDNW